MGFRKVYIDKRVIKEQYRCNGYEGLKKLFLSSDTIIFMTDRTFCEDIVTTLFDGLGGEDEYKTKLKISKILI